ncbi:hypothetical protein [Novosphingobium sp. CF614]|uniref:hypothetical protein n=1 Tax=Novosphingobium sp. CF614 TaxID=1884364 RepID=UPI0011608E1A|nr:hypothetical protein [Novosphingobium sp. CF614]
MSKISIRKALKDIIDFTLREGSIEHKLFHCEQWERDRYFEWKQEYEEWNRKIIELHGPTWRYEQYLNDTADHRELAGAPVLRPKSLRDKLFPPEPMRSGDPAEDYRAMIEPG